MPDGPMNLALDEAMQRAGWTPEQLASALNAHLRASGNAKHQVHAKTPWKWIRKGERPHEPLPGYVAEVLGRRIGQTLTPGDLGLERPKRASLVVPADEGLRLPFNSSGADSAVTELLTRGASDTRRFLPLRGPTLGQHAHRWLVANMQATNVANSLQLDESRSATTRVFRGLLDELRRLDDIEGGKSVGEWAARESVLAAQLLRERQGNDVTNELFRLVAEFAQLAGWGAVDSLRHASAQRWHLIALHAAQEIGDYEFVAYVLCILAFDATLANDHDQAVVILESAREGLRNRASLTVQAMLAGWLARAQAGAGDRAGFERTLSEASRLYERSRSEDAPEWAYWMVDPGQLAETARGWTLVGNPTRAISLLQHGIDDLGEEYPRDYVLHKAYLAEAHVSGSPDEAARIGLEILSSARELNSPRTLDVLNSVGKRLTSVDSRAVRRFLSQWTRQHDGGE